METDDEGVYTCQVITKYDMAEASGSLTLWGKMNEKANVCISNNFHSADGCSDDVVVVFPLRPSRPSSPPPDH